MSEPVVIVDQVSKAFPLTLKMVSLRQEAGSLLLRWLRPSAQVSRTVVNQFYALKNISFTVYPGEAVGLVGPNGAGKTTLLQLLARIMGPTSGQVTVNGRFVALISLGAGFIPTMTGRENIYLNAAFYGINPRQMDTILDEIIDFADIGDFINAPVKDYSSGMRARLGFSVAVHIMPDVVFIDEALAVGDAAFQAKCIARLLDLKAQQKTFIVVSHSMQTLQQLCDRGIWLAEGQIRADGDLATVLAAYARSMD